MPLRKRLMKIEAIIDWQRSCLAAQSDCISKVGTLLSRERKAARDNSNHHRQTEA